MILQKIINLFKKESDFELGYDVAKQEFTSYYDVSVNMASDLQNFRVELVEDYGEDYAKKTEAFIEKSVIFKEDMSPYIIADPTRAALIKKHQPDDYRFIHFIKFITDVYTCWEENTIEKAKAYCKFGMCLLDENEPYFSTYSKKFEEYKNEIMRQEWDRD